MARRTSSQGSVNSDSGTSRKTGRPASRTTSTRTASRPRTRPSLVAEEALRRHGVDALPALLVRRRDPVDVRVLGPRVVGRALVGRPRQDLHLVDRARALAVYGAEAIRARVAAAQDDHALVARRDEVRLRDEVALAAPVLEGEVLHGEVDAVELAPRDRQVARVAGAARQQERVVLLPQALRVHVDTHVGARHEPDALRPHLLEAAVEDALLHLELGDAVAQQAPDPVGALEDGDVVARAAKLLGGGQAGGPGPHDGDALAGPDGRGLGSDPALGERAVDDRQLDRLDRDGIVVDPEDARPFARGGAERAGELREVVRRVEAVDRLPPVVPVDQVVPVGDEVPERAALVAEGDAAVHAPGRLLLELRHRPGQEHLPPVAEPLGDRPVGLLVPCELEEAGDLAHVRLAVRPFHHGPLPGDAFLLGAAHRRQGPLVVPRHDLHETWLHRFPVGQDLLGDRALGVTHDGAAGAPAPPRRPRPGRGARRPPCRGCSGAGSPRPNRARRRRRPTCPRRSSGPSRRSPPRARRSCTRTRGPRRPRPPPGRRCSGPRSARRRHRERTPRRWSPRTARRSRPGCCPGARTSPPGAGRRRSCRPRAPCRGSRSSHPRGRA